MRIPGRILLGILALPALAWIGVAAYAYWPGPAEVPARALASGADRFLDVGGLELRYRTWGEPGPGKPNLLLVHGFANSLRTFQRLAPLLDEDFYVVAVDVPGFGLSAKPAAHDYGNVSQARTLARFAAALGLRRYVIGGHSMGGTLAVYAAVSDPHVAGVVLMNPGIVTTGVPALARYLVFPFPRAMARIFASRDFRARFLRRSFADQSLVTPEMLDEMMLATRSAGYLAGTTAMMGQYRTGDEPDVARRVQVPTLICWGMQDSGKPPGELAGLARLMPAARIVRFAEAGHYVHEEEPEGVAAAIIAAASAWQ